MQKDTLFCRFEAKPGSPAAAMTRPVVHARGKVQGVLSSGVGSTAAPSFLHCCCVVWCPECTGTGRLALFHH